MVASLAQDLTPERLLEEVEHVILVGIEHTADHLEREPAGHRGTDRQHPVAVVAEPRQPPPDHLAHALGELFGDTGSDPVAFDARERAALGEVPQDLRDEERVSFGLAVHRFREDCRRLLVADRLDERLHLVAIEPAQEDALVQMLSPQNRNRVGQWVRAVELDVSIRAHDQDALAAKVAREVLQQQQRRLVGPVQVVEHQHDRARSRRVREERRHALEHPQPLGVAFERG